MDSMQGQKTVTDDSRRLSLHLSLLSRPTPIQGQYKDNGDSKGDSSDRCVTAKFSHLSLYQAPLLRQYVVTSDSVTDDMNNFAHTRELLYIKSCRFHLSLLSLLSLCPRESNPACVREREE